jgi:hypothetical protein
LLYDNVFKGEEKVAKIVSYSFRNILDLLRNNPTLYHWKASLREARVIHSSVIAMALLWRAIAIPFLRMGGKDFLHRSTRL